MTGIWLSGAFLASAAFGWRLAALIWLLCVGIGVTRRRPRELAIVLLVGAAAGVGAVRSTPPPAAGSPVWVDAAEGVRGQVNSAPTSTGRSQSFSMNVTAVELDGEWQTASGTLCAFGPPLPRVGFGDRVVLFGEPEQATDQTMSIRAYMRHRGCDATVYANYLDIDESGTGWQRGFADVRARISGVLQIAAPGDSGALLSGLVTGDDQALTDGRQDAFRRTGTTHITAVSGSNVALVVSILVALGTAGGWRRQLGWQLAVVLSIWAYAVLVGGEPPVVRAALVASAAVLAVRVGRRPDFVTLIALAAAAMILVDPAQLWSLSFQLSFAASLAIVLVLTGLTSDGQLVGPVSVVRASVAAQVATLPILWVVIGQVSLTSLPANLIIAPLIWLAYPMAFVSAAAGLIWPPLAMVLVLPARLCAELVFLVVDHLGTPHGAMTVGESSPLVAMVVTTLAAMSILLMSRDTQRWARRLRHRLSFPIG